MPVKRVLVVLCVLSLFVMVAPARARGLLGERYVGVNGSATWPDDESGIEYDDPSWGLGGSVNLPVHENVDLGLALDATWVEGTAMDPVLLTSMDFEATVLDVAVTGTFHFLPEEEIDPFVAVGALYEDVDFDDLDADDDDWGPVVSAGAEFDINEADSVAASLTYYDILDEDDTAISGSYTHWFDESAAVTVGVTYGFDSEAFATSAGARFAF